MSDKAGLGEAYNRGFFGCFGALGAVVSVLAGLWLLGAAANLFDGWTADRKAASERVVASATPCARALVLAQRRYNGFDSFAAATAPEAVATEAGFLCEWPTEGSVFRVAGRVTCPDLTKLACVEVTHGTLDDVPLLEKRAD